MSRPQGSAAVLELRRRRAVELLAAGADRRAAATELGVHPKTLDRWLRNHRTDAARGLAAVPVRRDPPAVLADGGAELRALLAAGPAAHGLPPGRWTVPLVARAIAHRFGTAYHPEHVRKLLRRVGAALPAGVAGHAA